MWFITKVNFEDESVEVVEKFEDFGDCWDEFTRFLKNPSSVEQGAFRICNASDEEEAARRIKAQRAADKEIEAEQKGSPDRIVRRWAKAYGVDMHQAVTYITEGFRGGMSEEDWITQELKKVKSTGFDPGEGKGKILKHEKMGEELATVEFSRLVTIKEEKSRITEFYKLVKSNGRWLIDAINTK